jgi:hypothetical protein
LVDGSSPSTPTNKITPIPGLFYYLGVVRLNILVLAIKFELLENQK